MRLAGSADCVEHLLAGFVGATSLIKGVSVGCTGRVLMVEPVEEFLGASCV